VQPQVPRGEPVLAQSLRARSPASAVLRRVRRTLPDSQRAHPLRRRKRMTVDYARSELPADALRLRCALISRAAVAAGLALGLGQGRAIDAIDFALAMNRPGYNPFVIPREGSVRQLKPERFAAAAAASGNAARHDVYR
ncbi:MAG TPA: hypothetical protein VJR89_30070, partial [Polyangiales bacterium]|nr:hypothetical protein [Polyangiales bacterium]